MNIEDPSDNKYFARGSISFEVARPSKKRRYFIGVLIVLSICAVIVLLFFLLHHSHKLHISQTPVPNFYRYSPLRQFQNGAGAVCTDGTPCSIIGRNILKRSSSAIDGAIAAMVCNGLYTMQSMGIGGGFQMIYYRKQTRNIISINAREVAPLTATKDMFSGSAELSKTGGLSTAVPGELKGYYEAHVRYGSSISWIEMIQPTYDMCVQGYRLSKHQYDSVLIRYNLFINDPILRSTFIDEKTNKPKPIGSLIKPPTQLCDTLKKLMYEGPESFYSGSLADDFVADVQESGGIITKDDLLNYKVKIEKPVKVMLRNNTEVYTSPLPGSGVLLGFILKVLDGYDINPSYLSSTKSMVNLIQHVVEVFKHAFAFRTELGDTPLDDSENGQRLKQVLEKLSSDEYAEEVRLHISTNKTSNNIEDYGDGSAIYYNPDTSGTSHLSIIAPNGDAVSVTSSVNIFFGALVVGRRTGILLNDGMDDFSNIGYSNWFGLKPSPTNVVFPGRSALSSVTPTIVINEDGSVRLVIGAAGGPKITTATAYVILRHLWLKEDIKTATDAKRVHHQLQPMHLEYERGLSKEIVDELVNIGHTVKEYTDRGSVICVIANVNNSIYGNSDFRKDGDVCGFNPNDEILNEKTC